MQWNQHNLHGMHAAYGAYYAPMPLGCMYAPVSWITPPPCAYPSYPAAGVWISQASNPAAFFPGPWPHAPNHSHGQSCVNSNQTGAPGRTVPSGTVHAPLTPPHSCSRRAAKSFCSEFGHSEDVSVHQQQSAVVGASSSQSMRGTYPEFPELREVGDTSSGASSVPYVMVQNRVSQKAVGTARNVSLNTSISNLISSILGQINFSELLILGVVNGRDSHVLSSEAALTFYLAHWDKALECIEIFLFPKTRKVSPLLYQIVKLPAPLKAWLDDNTTNDNNELDKADCIQRRFGSHLEACFLIAARIGYLWSYRTKKGSFLLVWNAGILNTALEPLYFVLQEGNNNASPVPFEVYNPCDNRFGFITESEATNFLSRVCGSFHGLPAAAVDWSEGLPEMLSKPKSLQFSQIDQPDSSVKETFEVDSETSALDDQLSESSLPSYLGSTTGGSYDSSSEACSTDGDASSGDTLSDSPVPMEESNLLVSDVLDKDWVDRLHDLVAARSFLEDCNQVDTVPEKITQSPPLVQEEEVSQLLALELLTEL